MDNIHRHPPRPCADCGTNVTRSQRWPLSERFSIVLCLDCYAVRLFTEQVGAVAWASVIVREHGLQLDGVVNGGAR